MHRAPRSWTAGSQLDGGLPPTPVDSLLETQTDLRSLLEYLIDDDRPTVIVESLRQRPRIVWRNQAFKDCLQKSKERADFEEWIEALTAGPVIDESLSQFGGKRWFTKPLRHAWRIVQGRHVDEVRVQPQRPRPSSHTSQPSTWGDLLTEGGRRLIDWTRDSVDITTYPPWIQFVQGYDWASTELGAMKDWPEELCRLAVIIMSCPDPRMVYWGFNQAILYNEAAATIIGHRHPTIMGKRFIDVWGPEIHHRHMELLKAAIFNGRSDQASDFRAIVERNGMMEETFWNIHLLPVPGPNGHTIAAVNEYTETTSEVYNEQRRKVLARISGHTAQVNSLSRLWVSFLEDIRDRQNDTVYVAIYTVEEDSGGMCTFLDCVGTDPVRFPARVNSSELSMVSDLANAFRRARTTQQVVMLEGADLPAELMMDLGSAGIVRSAAVAPISSMNGRPLAFIIAGLNPLRRRCEEQTLFINHVRDLLLRFATVIVLPREQRKDQLRFEELNDALTQQLRITALKAEKNEDTFMRMAKNAPFGMYMYKLTGEPIFVNDSYLELLSVSRSELAEKSATGVAWRDTVYHEDVDMIRRTWETIITAKTPTKVEYRVYTPEGKPKWVENISFPELDEDENVLTVMGWLYDISHRKLTEALQAQRLEEALENKQASERFIDMTSHEMRNPLSAILQLADEISTSMAPPDSSSVTITSETAETILDAARTIILCAQHQRSIVDDLLTISKLDSNLLVITPDKINPVALISKALKMYEAELARADITASIDVKRSYTSMNLEHVMLDPSRLLQVVINLLTNAIKFTKDLPKRRITISLSASTKPPTGEEYRLQFAPQRQRSVSVPLLKSTEWGAGEEVYIQFTVKDTGKGLTSDEMKVLFQRFSQGNPRTYKQYGGSGLGLFISKELTELQGGQIGVQSDAGIGSTFAFFVKARRAATAEPDHDLRPTAPKRRCLTNGKAEAATTATAAAAAAAATTAPMRTPQDAEVTDATADKAPLHVLIVEDNAINQRVMAQQLRRLGCTVTTADHGLDALKFLATTTFAAEGQVPLDVVLLDVEMPIMDGLTCIAKIREAESAGEIVKHVPVIAITANARSEQINTALQAGMDEVVTKPFTIRDLLPRMQTLVKKMEKSEE